MTKSLAMIACAVGMTLLAGARADAGGYGGEELFASPVSVESESAPQSTPKDRWISEPGGKAESTHQHRDRDREELSIPRRNS